MVCAQPAGGFATEKRQLSLSTETLPLETLAFELVEYAPFMEKQRSAYIKLIAGTLNGTAFLTFDIYDFLVSCDSRAHATHPSTSSCKAGGQRGSLCKLVKHDEINNSEEDKDSAVGVTLSSPCLWRCVIFQ